MGSAARGMFGLPSMTVMAQRVELEILDMDGLGADIRVRAKRRR